MGYDSKGILVFNLKYEHAISFINLVKFIYQMPRSISSKLFVIASGEANVYGSSYYWNFRTSSFKQVACLILFSIKILYYFISVFFVQRVLFPVYTVLMSYGNKSLYVAVLYSLEWWNSTIGKPRMIPWPPRTDRKGYFKINSTLYQNAVFWLVDERGIFFYQFFVFSAFPPLPGYLPKNIPLETKFLL